MAITKVFIIDDDPAAQTLTRLALKKIAATIPCEMCSGGRKAVEALTLANDASSEEQQLLILLDWNLPDLHGRDVLHRLRHSPEPLGKVAIVVVTTSAAQSDRDQAQALGATDFVVKDADFGRFKSALKDIVDTHLPLAA